MPLESVLICIHFRSALLLPCYCDTIYVVDISRLLFSKNGEEEGERPSFCDEEKEGLWHRFNLV
jgi:hypothetical protein